MHSSHLLLEEPVRMASILEPSKPSFFPAMTKIVGTLGPKSRSVDVISSCLKAGMSVARFDFSWGETEFHQETVENLRIAIRSTKKLCAVMLDTVGPELQVVNKTEHPISLKEDSLVVLTPDQNKEATSNLLPINFGGLSKAVKAGDTIFIGQYLFTGSETTSIWLEVTEVNGEDVVCLIKNSATLAGSLYTLHVSQIRIDLPTLTDKDKEVISTWGVRNNIDFLSLSYTRHAEDVRHARDYLSKLGDLNQTQIFAKIENVEGLTHFDEILQEADGIILSRGNLGIDLPPEKSTGAFKEASRLASATPPPAYVLSSGIGWQGIEILLDGLFGTVTGSTVFVENVGLLGTTRVGSRRAVQISAGFMIFFSMLGKFGALFASIPFTFFAAVYCVFFGLVDCRWKVFWWHS